MDERIRSALAAAAPGRDVAEVATTDGSANHGNRTVRVRFTDGETAYLKVAVDGNRARLARAAAAVRYAGAKTGVTVPEVLASDPDGDPPYLLTAPLSGSAVVDAWRDGSVETRTSLLEAVGRTLAAVHAPRFERAGEIRGGDAGGLDIDAQAWSTVVAGMVPGADAFAGDRFAGFPERASEVVRAHRERLALGGPDGDRPAPALLHNDPRLENSFHVAGADSVGLIDWEQAMVGDPVLDVVKTEGRFLQRPDLPGRERLREALWDGYRERAGALPAGFESRRGVYRVVTFVGVAEGFDEWAPAVDEPDAELAAWVRSTFDRRVEQV